MARRKKADPRRGIAAALGMLACVGLAGCVDDGPYADATDVRQATYFTVVVRPGDTLSQIAQRYHSSTSGIAALNRLSDESRIRPGETLRIPAGGAATRDAVLGEASDTAARNYAPPPRPIDVARYEPHARVTVKTLAAPPQGRSQPATRFADSAPSHPAVAEIAAPPPAEDVDGFPRGDGRFAWPLMGEVISPFGSVGKGERNDGINIATPVGTPIHAAAAGTVTYSGNELKGYGNLVLIQHDDGYVTAYAHAESISVNRGDRVEKGQTIGLAGATGDVDRPQLHFEIRKGVQPINPRLLLASKG
jgi:murein DD-endopeptidase MepM/ murein hydrolase activator NlpD